MKAERKQVFNEINITPLTDIFLVLLIIMMVVAPLLEYRQLDLAVLSSAEAEESFPEEEAKSVRVTVEADGRISVGDVEVAPDGLVAEIQRQAVDNPDGLIIETHPDAPFEAMAQAMDAAEGARILHVATTLMDVSEPDPPAPEPVKPAAKSKTKKK